LETIRIEIDLPLDTNVDIAVVDLDEEAVDLDTFVALVVALEAFDFFRFDFIRFVAVDLVPLVALDTFEAIIKE